MSAQVFLLRSKTTLGGFQFQPGEDWPLEEMGVELGMDMEVAVEMVEKDGYWEVTEAISSIWEVTHHMKPGGWIVIESIDMGDCDECDETGFRLYYYDTTAALKQFYDIIG